MNLEQTARRHRCGLGLCKNIATHAVTFKRVGPRGNLYICPQCMEELGKLLAKNCVPKSPPNFLDPERGKYTIKEQDIKEQAQEADTAETQKAQNTWAKKGRKSKAAKQEN